MKKYFLLIIILCLSFTITGCVDYTELNELGIIETIGIDRYNDEYQISLTMLDAKSENDEQEETRKFYQATGATIAEAIQNIYLKSSKKIYLSHLEVLLVSEKVVSDDIFLLLDYFLRNQESRNAFLIMQVKDSSVQEIVEKTEDNTSIRDLVQINQEEYGITSLVTLEDFARTILEVGIDPVLPVIKLDDKRLEIDGYAYFQNQKFKGYLSKEESLVYNILHNKNSHIFLSKQTDNCHTAIKIEQLMTSSIIKKQNASYEIEGKLNVIEDKCQVSSKNDFQTQLKDMIENFIKKYQEQQVDLLGLQSSIRKNDYSFYQESKKTLWKEIKPQIKVTLEILPNPNQTKKVNP